MVTGTTEWDCGCRLELVSGELEPMDQIDLIMLVVIGLCVVSAVVAYQCGLAKGAKCTECHGLLKCEHCADVYTKRSIEQARREEFDKKMHDFRLTPPS